MSEHLKDGILQVKVPTKLPLGMYVYLSSKTSGSQTNENLEDLRTFTDVIKSEIKTVKPDSSYSNKDARSCQKSHSLSIRSSLINIEMVPEEDKKEMSLPDKTSEV